VSAPACPVCGGPLEIPAAGRRPVYCGKACRQAAYRARQAAERAVEQATWARQELARAGDRGQAEGLAHEFDHASRELFTALVRLHDLPPASARLRKPGGGWSGWEEHAAAAARQVARLAHRAAGLARVHERAAADFQAAQAVLRRGGLAGPGGDETPPGSVAARAAGDRATKHSGPPSAAVVDRDALFDAIEDVVYRLDRTRLYLLPEAAAEALEGPAGGLAEGLRRPAQLVRRTSMPGLVRRHVSPGQQNSETRSSDKRTSRASPVRRES